jgi:hypothetical protein
VAVSDYRFDEIELLSAIQFAARGAMAAFAATVSAKRALLWIPSLPSGTYSNRPRPIPSCERLRIGFSMNTVFAPDSGSMGKWHPGRIWKDFSSLVSILAFAVRCVYEAG